MKVLVAGAAGMVGSAVCRVLEHEHECIPVSRATADLTKRAEVNTIMAEAQPDAIVVAAAKVGGIHANDTFPADFIYENLMIETNLIDSAYRHKVGLLVFLGSSCIYPREATQPIRESTLLNGFLEPTNEAYAIAKIAGIKLCEAYNRQHGTDYRSLMPTNLYGPGDNFHTQNSHVIPGLMRRFHQAKDNGDKEVSVWGSGKPRREFLHVDDLAGAVAHVLATERHRFWRARDPYCSHLNVGTGTDLAIAELADMIRTIVGLDANLKFDDSHPDGTQRKLLDVSQMKALGWKPEIDLEEGLRQTYDWFLENQSSIRD